MIHLGDCPTGDCDTYNTFTGNGIVSIPSSSSNLLTFGGTDLLGFTYEGQSYYWESNEGAYATLSGNLYSENGDISLSTSAPRYVKQAFKEAQSQAWDHPGTYIMRGTDEATGDNYARVATQSGASYKRSQNIYYASMFPEVSEVGSMIPIVGSGYEFYYNYQDGNWGGAAFYGAMAISDLFLVKSIISGATKGGLKALTFGNKPWTTKEFWDPTKSYRALYGKYRFCKKSY